MLRNGSKIRRPTASGMPGPLSAISTSISSEAPRSHLELPRTAHRLHGVVDQVGPYLVELAGS